MDIAIIGGGAGGMCAAISAKQENNFARVTVFERNDRLGKKLLTTGNGRCNYTNVELSEKNFHCSTRGFVSTTLSLFGKDDAVDFFALLGILPYVDERGRYYPNSLQASSILDALRLRIEELGIEVCTSCAVKEIERSNKGFRIKSVNDRYFDRVIIATGGYAMPKSGSDGIGHRLARELGHRVTSVAPSIVPLKTDFPFRSAIDGVKVVAHSRLLVDGCERMHSYGDVLFTDYGISGPGVFDFSRTAVEELASGRCVEIGINLIGFGERMAEDYLTQRKIRLSARDVDEFLIGVINKKLIIPLYKFLNIDRKKKVAQISAEELLHLARTLSDFRQRVTGDMGFGAAQTTSGGVRCDEINPLTMESKCVKGLYFCGELCDVDGDCGGYNLQWAWSSGNIAGKCAAQEGYND